MTLEELLSLMRLIARLNQTVSALEAEAAQLRHELEEAKDAKPEPESEPAGV